MVVKEEFYGIAFRSDDEQKGLPDIKVVKLTAKTGSTLKGFPYITIDTAMVDVIAGETADTKEERIYIPIDKRVWFPYAIQGSIVQGEKSLTIKKGSDHMVYIIYITYRTDRIKKHNITIDGEIIAELNRDYIDCLDENLCLSSIQRIIEVTPNSTIKIEIDTKSEGKVCFIYTKGDITIIQDEKKQQ